MTGIYIEIRSHLLSKPNISLVKRRGVSFYDLKLAKIQDSRQSSRL